MHVLCTAFRNTFIFYVFHTHHTFKQEGVEEWEGYL